MADRQRPDDDQERAPSGQPVFRHVEAAPAAEVAPPDEVVRAAVEDHLVTYLGTPAFTIDEIVSDRFQLDVLVWEPTPDRPMYTLVTQGVSDLPMNVPPELVADGAPQRAEVMICLPPDWPMGKAALNDESAYFPIRHLKSVARIPHDYNTWIGFGHTIPHGEPPEPIAAGTDLSGWLLFLPLTLPPDFPILQVDGVGNVSILSMIALYPDEMEQKLNRGIESLYEGLEEYGVSELLDDLNRPSAADHS